MLRPLRHLIKKKFQFSFYLNIKPYNLFELLALADSRETIR